MMDNNIEPKLHDTNLQIAIGNDGCLMQLHGAPLITFITFWELQGGNNHDGHCSRRYGL